MSPKDIPPQFDGCSDEPEPAPVKRKRFEPIPAHKFATLEPAEWLVRDVLPLSELVVIFGPSQSGKTFLTLDILMAIAQGTDWFKNRTEKGRVVYIAAESARGVKKRIYAYAKHHNVDLTQIEFDIIPDCPNLLDTVDAKLLANMIGPGRVAVIDTFARSMAGGSENDGQDVGRAISACQAIHEKTKALVILIHHTGHTQDRARGWSGLKAAVDTEISVEALGNRQHVATITKQKDGDAGTRYGFELEQIHLGLDDLNQPITSCVVVPMDQPPEKHNKGDKGMGKWQRYALQAFSELYVPTTRSFVPVDQLITKTAEMGLAPDDGKDDRRRDSAKRAIEGLIEDKKLNKSNNFITKA